jgi:hypothetical protein
VLGFMNAYPAPNGGFQGTNNFFQTRPSRRTSARTPSRSTIVPTQNQTMRFRHQRLRMDRRSMPSATASTARSPTGPAQPDGVAESHLDGSAPTTVNEFLVTASVDRVYIGIDREGERFAPQSQYGINYPYIFPSARRSSTRSRPSTLTSTLDGGPYPAFSTGPIYTIATTRRRFTATTPSSSADVRALGQNDFDQINVTGVPGGTNNQNGRFIFSDLRAGAATTGVAIGNAAMGLFDTYAEIGPRAYTPYRSNTFEWFLQDSWRATQRLKLEFGLRHTMMNPYYYSLWRNMAVFDPSRYDPALGRGAWTPHRFILSGDRFNGV